MIETTDAMSQSFEDSTVSLQAPSQSLQAPSHAAENGRLTDGAGGGDSWLSASVPVTRGLDLADRVTSTPSSAVSRQSHGGDSATVGHQPGAAGSTQSHSSAVDSVVSSVKPRSVTPGDFLSFDSETHASSTASHDVDDIFADSSLFATCEYE